VIAVVIWVAQGQVAAMRSRRRRAAYAAMKWPLAAAHTRAGIADALATITPALLTPGRDRPPASALRAALYGHAFNPARAGTDPGPAATTALTWASHHCLPLTALAALQVTRRALEALALRLDGTRAAATTIIRKRAVFHDCLGCAAELGLLAANPLDRITWRPSRSSCSADPPVSGHTCRGAGHLGRGHPDPPGADRVSSAACTTRLCDPPKP
jgi:hypothetical protein